jgi:anti-repressor protein
MELITIKVNKDRITLSARELHEFLEIGTRFNVWFPRMCEYGFNENIDFQRVAQKCDTLGGLQDIVDYQITIEMAKEIAMIQRTEKGKQARQYFIQLEKDWNSPQKVMARALIMSQEEVEALRIENKELKPKALFADAVSASDSSILVGDLAKIIKQNGVDIGQKRLFSWLRDNGFLIKRKGSDWNMPTQKAMDMELFEIKESTHVDGNGVNITTRTPKVTGKGQIYFVNKFCHENA